VTLLATNLEELITRDPSRFMRSLEQEMNISKQLRERWCQRMSQIAGNCHYISKQDCAPAHNSKRSQDWLKESFTRYVGRRSGLPAPMTATIWTV
jgi:hypothetical protein